MSDLGWMTKEKIGSPIYCCPEVLDSEHIKIAMDEGKEIGPESLREHMDVIFHDLLGISKGKVFLDSRGSPMVVDTGGSFWILDFDEENNFWVVTGGINKTLY